MLTSADGALSYILVFFETTHSASFVAKACGLFCSRFARRERVRHLHDHFNVRNFIKTPLPILWGILMLAACQHPGPVLDFGSRPPSVGGTISGIVTTTDSSISAENRQVTVTNVQTATRYQARTAIDGGYTIQVPEGTYHIEVALEPGELYTKRPENTHIDKSDLDLHLDFVIAAK